MNTIVPVEIPICVGCGNALKFEGVQDLANGQQRHQVSCHDRNCSMYMVTGYAESYAELVQAWGYSEQQYERAQRRGKE